MDITKHCELCENRRVDLSVGTICSLTNLKPDFVKKCTTISFGENHTHRIKEVNIEYYKVASTRLINVAHFILYLIIGSGVMLAGYFLGALAWEKEVIPIVPLIILGTGFLFIPFATGPLINFGQNLKVVKDRKNRMDDLLKSYNIEYDIEIVVDQDVHGNKAYMAKIYFSRYYSS